MKKRMIIAVIIPWVLSAGPARGAAEPEVLKEFQDRVRAYVEIHRKAEEKVPPLKDESSPERINAHQEALAEVIRRQRQGARQGDVFSPAVSEYVRGIILSETRGRQGAAAREATKEGNPRVEGGTPVKLSVNARYPEKAPLSVVPPDMLLKLPKLPEELDYRFVGPHLILRDTTANLIVDYILNVVPAAGARSGRSPAPGNAFLPAGSAAQTRGNGEEDRRNSRDLRLPLAADSVRFAVIGDSGTGDEAQYDVARELFQLHRAFPYEFVLMMGDNLYGDEDPKDYKRKFERPYREIIDAGVKFYASLGNHDLRTQSSYVLFNMSGKRYYTFQPGDDVRFVALDSNYMDREQIEWFEKELAGSGSGWKIVFFHHPIYSSGKRHGPSLELRKTIEPLLIRHRVSVVFQGHEHFYERIKPQNGVHYFISGAGGKLRRDGIGRSSITASAFDQDRHFMLVEIAGDQMHFQVISRTGKTVDSGVIDRPAAGQRRDDPVSGRERD